MQLELTKKQYQQLVELVFLGEWMLNSYREEPLDDYSETIQQIYAQTDKFEVGGLMEQNVSKEYVPSEQLADAMFEYADAYDEFIFRNSFIRKFAERDFERKYKKEQLETMGKEEEQQRKQPFINKYARELDKNGIKNIEIIVRDRLKATRPLEFLCF